MKTEYKVLSPTAILGYGFPAESFRRGMDLGPDLIAVDGGSTDPGPYYLGAGKSFTHRKAVKRDLSIMLPAARKAGIPLVIGTAGGSGARPHVEWCADIIREIAEKHGLSFRMGVISADIPKELVLETVEKGATVPLGPQKELTRDVVEETSVIVAQMGHEPVDRALEEGCEVILAGRCYDPVSFAAPAVKEGFDVALSYHMGKILECASIAADPPDGKDCVLGILERDSFRLKALSPDRKFTRVSTAAHSLYEKSDPFNLPGPGGSLDLSDCEFEELENGEVRVSGTRFVPTEKNMVKLEGVRRVGYRSISIAGTRDPLLIGQIDEVLEHIKEVVAQQFDDFRYRLLFHVYGKNGVMGNLEVHKEITSHELGIVIEGVADTEEQSGAVVSLARSSLLHYGYPGRISTAGNLAVLFSPSDIACGEVYEFSIYHLMECPDPLSLFPVEVEEV